MAMHMAAWGALDWKFEWNRVFAPGGSLVTYRVCRDPFVRAGRCVVALLVCFASCVLTADHSQAQETVRNLLTYPKRPPQPKPPEPAADGPMLVQASEIKYDYTNN